MLKKHLLAAGGTLSLGLGIAGMFLPVLPTTPFLLLAAYCYLRSSKRLYDRLMSNRLLGGYIRNYLQYRAVSRNAKIASLAALWVSLSVSFAVIGSAAVRLVLVLAGIGVTVHLLTLKTLPVEAERAGSGVTNSRKSVPTDSR